MQNENPGSGIKLSLASGFDINVKPLPPYYIDIIEEILPLPDFPTRKILLAAGDVANWEYTPPENPVEEDHEDYSLYVKWKSVEKERELILAKRDKARKDFLLSNCVSIIDGPVDFDDDDWVYKVEASFENYNVPEHYGKRLLVFLKTQVITLPSEVELIISTALYPEVTMQGIIRALHGFQGKVEKQGSNRNYTNKARRKHRS